MNVPNLISHPRQTYDLLNLKTKLSFFAIIDFVIVAVIICRVLTIMLFSQLQSYTVMVLHKSFLYRHDDQNIHAIHPATKVYRHPLPSLILLLLQSSFDNDAILSTPKLYSHGSPQKLPLST
ncbi:uncharacterized protein SAPINGB_P004046 [Magnusiomyces paraingens]|uniref:Uncharacterized protein n=1 Tax=Magnusiomyces paraingens TaxID=2606893 RepID=A0A5E8BUN9_9ASCO|nr:uncharacterized protein SAPINGB_P004046 [Saprochaete ingens]VVT54379.1 unnamed protein product [Saprochaete ingens]